MCKKSKIWLCFKEEESFTKTNERLDKSFAVHHGYSKSWSCYQRKIAALSCLTSEKPWKVELTFKLDFVREGVLCCNCYIMRVSLTSCHILAVFFYLLVQGKAMSPLKQMEKICLSSSCGNLISPNSCLALYKHEVRESPISNQSLWLTFPANCARGADLERRWRSIIIMLEEMRGWCALVYVV